MTGWISVKDRLPVKDGKHLIVADGDVNVGIHFVHRGVWIGTDGEEMLCVTHWMELPEAPEEK